MHNGLSNHQTVSTSQHTVTQKEDITRSTTLSGLVAVLFPLMIVMMITGYKKYKVVVRQRRINRLNRMWNLAASKKFS